MRQVQEEENQVNQLPALHQSQTTRKPDVLWAQESLTRYGYRLSIVTWKFCGRAYGNNVIQKLNVFFTLRLSEGDDIYSQEIG